MNLRQITFKSMLSLSIIFAIPAIASSCSGANNSNAAKTADKQTELSDDNHKKGGRVGGPQLGTPGGGPAIDKSDDATLQAMIKTEIPEFKQLEFTDA